MGQVISRKQLTDTLAPLRDKGQVIVTTNGCFDILHVGHLRYLREAKALGDILIVAINSDGSVRGLKGDNRPVITESERAEMLAALDCVDYVVMFEEPTPESLLQEIKPAIHVKGDQYSEDNLPEAATLKSLGTQIRFVPMVAGHSTSNLIERILKLYGNPTSADENKTHAT